MSTSNAPADYLRTSSPPGQLLWRYATRYGSANGTGQYVMVRDNAVAHGDGNWVFVPRSCLRLTDTLNPGQTLNLFKESLISRDARYAAVMQEDGNFVVYNASTYLWHTHTNGYSGAYLIMQTDGNLVVYASGGSPYLWASWTQKDSRAWWTSMPGACRFRRR